MLPKIMKNINEKKVNFAIKIKYFFLLVNIYNIYMCNLPKKLQYLAKFALFFFYCLFIIEYAT